MILFSRSYDTVADTYYPEWTLNDDGSGSNALCVDTATCLQYCSDLNNDVGEKICIGADVHATLPRCYLNLKTSASTYVATHTYNDATQQEEISFAPATQSCLVDLFAGQLTHDPDYEFYYVAPDSHPVLDQRRRLMYEKDVPDYAVYPFKFDTRMSNERRLLFGPVTIGTPRLGGSLKVCFCDSQALPYSSAGSGARTTCSESADFGLLLGYFFPSLN